MARVSTSNSAAEGAHPAPLLAVRDAVKRYGSRTVIDVPHLDIWEGDRIQLIGTNGSGKSTLARLLVGHGVPTSGRVTSGAGTIALLPQSGGFYRQMTLFQNLLAIARLHGRRSQMNEYTEQAVTALGLAPFLDRPVVTLSGGMQRLAGIAAIFGAQPAAIVLDEPFAGLDSEKSARVRDLLRDHTSAFRFVIVLGHQVDDALDMPRIVHVEGGAITSDSGEGARA